MAGEPITMGRARSHRRRFQRVDMTRRIGKIFDFDLALNVFCGSNSGVFGVDLRWGGAPHLRNAPNTPLFKLLSAVEPWLGRKLRSRDNVDERGAGLHALEEKVVIKKKLTPF